MFSFLKRKKEEPEVFLSVLDGLKSLYKKVLLPLEQAYDYHEFHSPPLTDADFDAKPMVMLVGQYSTGKTTFIQYLLERDFPDMRIGPEPTTDRFMIVTYGEGDAVIPGNALVVDPKYQFTQLSKFGSAFLNKFQVSQCKNKVLESLSLVDTPGILSGEKQRVDRGYEFTTILEWFAERVDRIILFFDAHKLDISDEFRRSIEVLKSYEDKIRIVLNKADMINAQQLMRVYGALMWSLGKIFTAPEIVRVYIGTFRNHMLAYDDNRRLFEREHEDLFQDLQGLPRNSALRKLNDLIRRARLAKVHAYIVARLKQEMPSVFGKDGRKRELIDDLGGVYAQIQRERNISAGDFPDVQKMKDRLAVYDFRKLSKLQPKLLENVDRMLAEDMSRLMSMMPQKQLSSATDGPSENPFNLWANEGADYGRYMDEDWVVQKDKERYCETFRKLVPFGTKMSGAVAKGELVKSRLPNAVLAKIWRMSDIDEDGLLDEDEWALANHLVKIKVEGHELPLTLPDHLIPPSKR